MAGAALLGRLTAAGARHPWRVATAAEVRRETADARTLALDVPGWPGHDAGQHVDVRLTAEDGYQAQRAYSIASAPGDARLELTVERVRDGEVSPWFVDEARPGDRFELRGPIGGYFSWTPERGGPLFLVGGGSGVVPLRSILRHRGQAAPEAGATLLLSARTADEVLYSGELSGEAVLTFTREAPEGWTGLARRVDRAMLAELAPPPEARPRCYVCGPTGFVERVAEELAALGHHRSLIRTERFGPTGSAR